MGIFPVNFNPSYLIKFESNAYEHNVLPNETWFNHHFVLTDYVYFHQDILTKIDSWIISTIKGKVGYYQYFPLYGELYYTGYWVQHFYFEDDNDALMFKLTWAEFIMVYEGEINE